MKGARPLCRAIVNFVGSSMYLRSIAAIGMAAALSLVPPALAQSPELPTEDEADVPVQPEAVEVLDKMAAFLRGLQEFRLTATTTRDDVTDDGLKIQIAGRSIYEVRTPDKLKLEVVNDKQTRLYYYDGKTVTQYAPSLGAYSVIEAPETIVKMLDAAAERYDVQIPLADLFYWGTERSNVRNLSSGFFVGESRIGDHTCNHYAYRVEGADFQVWLRKSGDPLPCRLVITTTDDDARPEFGATLSWELEPDLGDAVFAFSPPAGAEQIEQQALEGTK